MRIVRSEANQPTKKFWVGRTTGHPLVQGKVSTEGMEERWRAKYRDEEEMDWMACIFATTSKSEVADMERNVIEGCRSQGTYCKIQNDVGGGGNVEGKSPYLVYVAYKE